MKNEYFQNTKEKYTNRRIILALAGLLGLINQLQSKNTVLAASKEDDMCVITDTGVNIRSGSSTSHNIRGQLDRNSVGTLVNEASGDNWHEIENNGITGFVSPDFTEVGLCGDFIVKKMNENPDLVYLESRTVGNFKIFGTTDYLTDQQIIRLSELIKYYTINLPKKIFLEERPIIFVFANKNDIGPISAYRSGDIAGLASYLTFNGTFLSSSKFGYGGDRYLAAIVFNKITTHGNGEVEYNPIGTLAHEMAHVYHQPHVDEGNPDFSADEFGLYTRVALNGRYDDFVEACVYGFENSYNYPPTQDYHKDFCFDVAMVMTTPETPVLDIVNRHGESGYVYDEH